MLLRVVLCTFIVYQAVNANQSGLDEYEGNPSVDYFWTTVRQTLLHFIDVWNLNDPANVVSRETLQEIWFPLERSFKDKIGSRSWMRISNHFKETMTHPQAAATLETLFACIHRLLLRNASKEICVKGIPLRTDFEQLLDTNVLNLSLDSWPIEIADQVMPFSTKGEKDAASQGRKLSKIDYRVENKTMKLVSDNGEHLETVVNKRDAFDDEEVDAVLKKNRSKSEYERVRANGTPAATILQQALSKSAPDFPLALRASAVIYKAMALDAFQEKEFNAIVPVWKSIIDTLTHPKGKETFKLAMRKIKEIVSDDNAQQTLINIFATLYTCLTYDVGEKGVLFPYKELRKVIFWQCQESFPDDGGKTLENGS
ncbi:hypothetical protein U1Q18_047260 [Sarracenia purpurea var. burkii]